MVHSAHERITFHPSSSWRSTSSTSACIYWMQAANGAIRSRLMAWIHKPPTPSMQMDSIIFSRIVCVCIYVFHARCVFPLPPFQPSLLADKMALAELSKKFRFWARTSTMGGGGEQSFPYPTYTHTHPGGLFFQNQGRSSSTGLIIETIGKQIKWIRPFKNPHSLHSIEIRKRLPRDSWISIPLLLLGSHTNTKLVFDFLEPTWTFMRLRWRRCAKNIKEWGIHTTYHQLLLTEINCGSPGILPNGWLEGQKTTLHAVVTFRCQEGMTFEGPSYRTICLADGRWSHPLPRCYGKFFFFNYSNVGVGV